jgi:hypothetical protein
MGSSMVRVCLSQMWCSGPTRITHPQSTLTIQLANSPTLHAQTVPRVSLAVYKDVFLCGVFTAGSALRSVAGSSTSQSDHSVQYLFTDTERQDRIATLEV